MFIEQRHPRDPVPASTEPDALVAELTERDQKVREVIERFADEDYVERQSVSGLGGRLVAVRRTEDEWSGNILVQAEPIRPRRRAGLEDLSVGTDVFQTAGLSTVGRCGADQSSLERGAERAAESVAGIAWVERQPIVGFQHEAKPRKGKRLQHEVLGIGYPSGEGVCSPVVFAQRLTPFPWGKQPSLWEKSEKREKMDTSCRKKLTCLETTGC